MKTLTLKLLLMAIPLIMFACGGQQNRTGNTSDNDSTLNSDTTRSDAVLTENNMGGSNNDEDFIKEAVSGGLMEVELGRYAQQNAQNPRVRNFGAMMVRDHTKANDELKALLTQKSITIPATMEDTHHNKMTDIQKKTGTEFDMDYISEMVDDHEKDVDKFKKMAENGNDAELKTFAAKTLPVLLMHQDSAKKIMDALK